METKEQVENVASSILDTLNIKDNEEPEDLLQRLQRLRCPFTWDIPNESAAIKSALVSAEKKEEYLISISSPLIRCFEYAKNGDLNQALKVLQDWDLSFKLDVMLGLDVSSDDSEAGDDVEDVGRAEAVPNVKDIANFLSKVPYFYVFDSCECFLLYKLKRFEECEKKLKSMESYGNFSPKVQAAVCWLQALVILEYGYEGQKQAIAILEDALKLYPKCRDLHTLLGLLLGRVRRVENWNAIPDCREINMLENALRESYGHRTAVYLALAYREYSKNLQRSSKAQDSDTRELIEDMYRKATELYSKVFEEHESDYCLATRVAEGFTRLPPPWQDLEKAEICLKRALSLCEEDPYLNHIAGTLYTKKRDLGKAVHFLTLASDGMTRNHGACMDLMVIKQQLDPQYNPVSDLESLLVHITEEPHVEDILCNLGAFFYVEMKDFEKAFGYWLRMIERNIHSQRLKFLHCRLVKPPNVNINKIIVHELQKKIERNLCSDEEKAILERLLTLYPNLKVLRFERNKFDGAKTSYSSRSRWWNSSSHDRSSDKNEGSWRRTEPLPPLENHREIGNPSSERLDSHSDFTPGRQRHFSTGDSSEGASTAENAVYYRPGNRFGRSYESGSRWRDFGSSSRGTEGHSTRDSFWRREENSSRSSLSENWRSRPARCSEDIAK